MVEVKKEIEEQVLKILHGIVGLGKAIELATDNLEEHMKKLTILKR